MKKKKERTKCEIFSRVCGYYRPLQNWNVGKVSEFAKRVLFKINGGKTNGKTKKTTN